MDQMYKAKVGYKNGGRQEVCSLGEEVFINHQL